MLADAEKGIVEGIHVGTDAPPALMIRLPDLFSNSVMATDLEHAVSRCQARDG